MRRKNWLTILSNSSLDIRRRPGKLPSEGGFPVPEIQNVIAGHRSVRKTVPDDDVRAVAGPLA